MEELIKEVAKKADDQLDFKKIIGGMVGQGIEWFDKKIIEGALNYLVAKVPVEYEEDLEILFESYVDEDYEALGQVFTNRLNYIINIPGLDEEDEAILLDAIADAVIKLIQRKIKKAKLAA